MATISPDAPPSFNCAVIEGLPFGGVEILSLTIVFLFVVVTYTVTFVDVAIKQLWPEKYLDPVVAQRVKDIQKWFPKIVQAANIRNGQGGDAADVPCTDVTGAEGCKNVAAQDVIHYDRVVSQSPYLAGRTVDEDLVCVLANNDAFSTVSSYCACTVRGYMMLSTLLLTAGMCIGYLWTNNTMIDPTAADEAGKVAMLGYVMVFLTGIMMTSPDSSAVQRNANVVLWSNIPLKVDGKKNPLLGLHELGIGSFLVLPLLAHGYKVLTVGESMPNYVGLATGCAAQLSGVVCFGLPILLAKCNIITKLQGKQYEILGEIICVFASFLAYIQNEFYATATCAGMYTTFNYLMYASVAAPFALWIARRYPNSSTSFPTEPSVMLTLNGTPVAVSGPPSVMQFDQNPAVLPVLPPAPHSCV